jgi:hypothetical protein
MGEPIGRGELDRHPRRTRPCWRRDAQPRAAAREQAAAIG